MFSGKNKTAALLKKTLNLGIVAAILAILYFTMGFSFVEFYFGGKDNTLHVAEAINKLCNDNGVCPETLDGWQPVRKGVQRKDQLLYFAADGDRNETASSNPKPQTFRLVYSTTLPDHWFEAQGGVGKQVNSGWKSR